MYTVIVAEDEEGIRRAIIKNVKWIDIGFQVIGEAENGADALDMVEKLEPDLLITDIRMPFINGIELARQIREVRPTVQIMFLSGFDDFSYAQQAIQYNIISYVLKPVSSEELTKELIKVRETMDRRFDMFNRSSRVQREMEKSEFLLPLLLDGTPGSDGYEDELRKVAATKGLFGKSGSDRLCFTVLVTYIRDEDGKDRTQRRDVEAVDLILSKYVRSVSCFLRGRIVSLLAATQSGFDKYLHILAEEIVQSIVRMTGLKCSIGISRSVPKLMDCRECYLEAVNAASYSLKEDSIHYIADEEQGRKISQDRIREQAEELEGLLRGGTGEELDAYLDRLEQEVRRWGFTVIHFGILLFQISAKVYGVVYATVGDEASRLLQDEYPMRDVRLLENVSEGMEMMRSLCLRAKEMIAEQRKKSSEVICEKALYMIEEGYADQDISILSVSSVIGVSSNYLSTLIRKTTGSTFVELLTNKRIEAAKELLLTSSKKIHEIADSCGYRDQYYFSHCFKKATGMSPKECRRKYEEQQG